MNKEYIKYFDLFHKEKSLFESNKKKHLKCDGCENKKKIIEKDNKLLFNCGSKKGECGDQFEINLPQYINYHYEIKRLNELIHGTFEYKEDINDLSEYNLETLDKYMKIPDELKKQNELIKDSEEKKIELEKKYKSLNDINSKKELIQEYNTIKTKGEITKIKLLRELVLETTTDEKKSEIKKEYAKLIYENDKIITPLLYKLNEEEKYEIKIKEEEINIFKIKEKEEKVKQKTSRKIIDTKDNENTENNEKLIELIINKFKGNNGILTKIEYKKITDENDFKTKWSPILFKSLQNKGTNSWLKIKQKKYGSIIVTPESKNPKILQLTDIWMEYLKINKLRIE